MMELAGRLRCDRPFFFNQTLIIRKDKLPASSSLSLTVSNLPNAGGVPQSGYFGRRRNTEANDWISGVKEGHRDVPFDGRQNLSGLTSMGELSGGSIIK